MSIKISARIQCEAGDCSKSQPAELTVNEDGRIVPPSSPPHEWSADLRFCPWHNPERPRGGRILDTIGR